MTNLSNWLIGMFLLNHFTTLVRNARATYESDIASKVINPWAQVNQTAKVKPCIGTLERKDGTTTSNDTEIATMLNDYFLFLIERTQNLYPGLFPDLFLQLLISSL